MGTDVYLRYHDDIQNMNMGIFSHFNSKIISNFVASIVSYYSPCTRTSAGTVMNNFRKHIYTYTLGVSHFTWLWLPKVSCCIYIYIYICWFNFDALAQGNAYKPTKEPTNYRGPGGDRTHDLQTEATPPAIYTHIYIYMNIHIKFWHKQFRNVIQFLNWLRWWPSTSTCWIWSQCVILHAVW